jgi:hypothetical protein
VVGEGGAHAEVDDLEALLLAGEEHDVLGLEVAVHDVVRVAVVDGRQQLLHVQARLRLRQRLLLHDPPEQLPALAVVHHDVDIFLLVEDVVDAHDVGVVLS